jgi:hypothetical protein
LAATAGKHDSEQQSATDPQGAGSSSKKSQPTCPPLAARMADSLQVTSVSGHTSQIATGCALVGLLAPWQMKPSMQRVGACHPLPLALQTCTATFPPEAPPAVLHRVSVMPPSFWVPTHTTQP